jgi:K+ transporter
MRADNRGESGIFALMALTGAHWSGRRRWLVIYGLFGAALIYGDGIITPAISVLSAVEGLNVAAFKSYTLPRAALILVVLFSIKRRDRQGRQGIRTNHADLVCGDRNVRHREDRAPSYSGLWQTDSWHH